MTPEEIRAIQAAHSLNNTQLAARLFVTRDAVQRWLSGKTTPGRRALRMLEKLKGEMSDG